MSIKDYYSILDIPHDASEREIKKAYRVQAKKFHPDSSNIEESEDIFKEITEAYGILSDPEKKKKYDYSLPKPKPPPSSQDEFRSAPKTERHSQQKAKPFPDNKHLWREHNARLRPEGRTSSGKYTAGKQRFKASYYFQTYQGQKNLKLGGGVLLALIAVVLLSLLLLPPSLIKKNSGGELEFSQDLGNSAETSSPNHLNRQRKTRQIRDDLYRELIVRPEEEQQNTGIRVYNNSDGPRAPSGNERLFQPDGSRDLLEEIWNDVQDNQSGP